MKEYNIAVEVQSLKSKVPTDFRFEETKISIDLNKVVWFKQYWHVGTDKFQESHTEVLLFGLPVKSATLYLSFNINTSKLCLLFKIFTSSAVEEIWILYFCLPIDFGWN